MKTLTLASATLLLGGLFASAAMAQMDSPSTSPASQDTAAADQKESAGASDEANDEGFKLFRSPWLESRRITIGGWIDQGFTYNPSSPANKFNGPINFNDRANEYQMNQLYLFAERVTKTDGRGFDLGGRVDFLYGTDYRFVQGVGLESNWTQDERFYGLAMPQAYGDVAINDLVIRAGRFYCPGGVEAVMATQNFFYSHSYSFQYGSPQTLTGVEGIYKLNDRLNVVAGAHQGWDVVTKSDAHVGMLMGFNWSIDEKNELGWSILTGDEPGNTVNQYRTLSSFVYTHKFTDKFRYMFEGDVGRQEHVVYAHSTINGADWYGLVNYLVYDLNPCWSVGARYEYFVDKDGAMVHSDGYPHTMPLGGVASDWQELSLGVNYKPNSNVLVRSEIRWDFCDPRVDADDGPFDDYSSRQQILWGTDLIVKY